MTSENVNRLERWAREGVIVNATLFHGSNSIARITGFLEQTTQDRWSVQSETCDRIRFKVEDISSMTDLGDIILRIKGDFYDERSN